MAIGDSADILGRLKRLIPAGWFLSAAPNRDAVFGGIADNLTQSYSLINTAKLQTRISTATGFFLDLIAFDFFGLNIERFTAETDAAFRARILKEILRLRVTRAGIIQAITDLTGIAPVFTQPSNPADTFAWDISFWDIATWGSTQLNNQIFIIAYRPLGGGIANIPGWDIGYWDTTFYWVDQSMITAPVSDAQIYATIAATVAAGVTAWVMIQNPPSANSSSVFDNLFVPLLGSI